MQSLLKYISIDVMVILMSMIPLIEVKGAIPFGVASGLSPLSSLILSLIGSTIPIPFILIGIRPLFKALKKFKPVRKIINTITSKAMHKSENVVKYGFWGLIVFVGIPLPGTGVWSGSLIAALLNMRIKIAFPAIFIGNVIAGTIMYLLSYTTIKLFN